MTTKSIMLIVLAVGWSSLAASAAIGQVNFTGIGGELPPGDVVCYTGGGLRVSDNGDTCQNGTRATGLTFGDTDQITITANSANFNVPVNISSTNFQASGLQAFSGTTTFNSTTSFVGPSVTFSTGTTFNNAADFNASMTTAGISNTGTIATQNLSVDNSLIATDATITNVAVSNIFTVTGGSAINMGGNQVRGVAAGTAATDAVNVAQLNAVTGNVDAVQATVSTHTAQIAAVEAVNTTQASQITAIQAVNTTQSGQITALQAAQDLVDGRVDTLFDLRGTDRRDMKQGVASAMAMASAPMPSGPGRVSYAVNGATFRGEYALGASLNYRLNTEAPMAISVGASFAGNKNNGVRVGIAGEF